MTIKINHIDAQNEDKRLGQEEWRLKKKLKEVQARRRIVQKAILENEEGEKSWIIELPITALPMRKAAKGKVNWKKLVWETFERYKIPMSTELMCHKLWLHYQEVGFDKRIVMQNVSAALSALETKDQKQH